MSAWQVPVASVAGAASRTIPWRSNGQLRLTVLTKAAFDFEPNGSMKMAAPPVEEIIEGDMPAGEDAAGSVRTGSDLVPFKPRAEATCWGYAYAPGGIPVPRLQARIAIANQTGITFDKVIDVIGDRTLANPNPVPFLKMPLVFERAYGGPGFGANPVGVGFGPRANILPNLLYPKGWNRDTEPAVFAPIPSSWGRRSRLMGNQPLNFSGDSVATIPEQLDVAYFQNAPEDQRLASLEGNEWLLFEHLHPKHSRMTTRLPDIAGMVMAFGFQGADKQIPLRLDSLVIDAEREKCIVTCRGSIPIPNEASLDDLRLAAGIGWGGQTIDWTEANRKALQPVHAPVGTAVLDPNASLKFVAPYEIAKPGVTDLANVRPAAAIPGAPFVPGGAAVGNSGAASSAAPVGASGGLAAAAVIGAVGLAAAASAAPAAGQAEMTLIGGDLQFDPSAGMPFPGAANWQNSQHSASAPLRDASGPDPNSVRQGSAEGSALDAPPSNPSSVLPLSMSPTSALPGAPFSFGGEQPLPRAPVASVEAATLPLGDDAFFPPDFDALLKARAASRASSDKEPEAFVAPNGDGVAPTSPTDVPSPTVNPILQQAVAAAAAHALEASAPVAAEKSNSAWAWAQQQAAPDAAPQQQASTPAPAPMRPTEPSPRALIYSGFTKK